MSRPLALVAGGSRGIGAATARRLARGGLDVILTYRSRVQRGQDVAADVRALGVEGVALPLDLCDAASRRQLLGRVTEAGVLLDLLVLSASGGLEPGAAATYAADLNTDAPTDVVLDLLPVMRPGASLVYLTSHEAHFHRPETAHPVYGRIAATKKAGERRLLALRDMIEPRGVTLKIISADVVEDTATAKLLLRLSADAVETRRSAVGRLPTVDDVAEEVWRRHLTEDDWGTPSFVWDPVGYASHSVRGARDKGMSALG